MLIDCLNVLVDHMTSILKKGVIMEHADTSQLEKHYNKKYHVMEKVFMVIVISGCMWSYYF